MNVWVDKAQACLVGVQIGDALGQPVETMKREEILQAQVQDQDGTVLKISGRPIEGFLPAIQKRISQTAQLIAGDTTDDWQLTRAVARSLIASGGYDQNSMARSHIAALFETNVGWGGTTKRGIKEIFQWHLSNGQAGRSPQVMAWEVPVSEAGLPKVAGNGVAMKVSSLAIFYAINTSAHTVECGEPSDEMEGLMPMVEKLAGLTHPSSEAFLTAYALAVTISRLLVKPVRTLQDRADLIRYLRHRVGEAERCIRRSDKFPIGEAVEHLGKVAGDPEAVFREITPGFRAGQSVLYAIGMFLCYPTNFRKAVLTAVNDGGDSDSTASMVGALVGANCGLEVIPEEWRTFRPEFQESIELGSSLCGC